MPDQYLRANRFSAKRLLALSVIVFFTLVSLAFIVVPRFPSLAQTVKPQANTAVQHDMVGADCKSCHGAVVASFQSEIHGKSAKFSEGATAASCESCHGDTAKHVEVVDATDKVQPVAGKPVEFNAKGEVVRLNTKEVNQSCLKCHSQDRSHENWYGGKHDTAEISCISCHSVHHSKSPEGMLTRPNTEETCLSCHTSVRKAVYQRSTHLFRNEHGDAKVGCTSCHNPHGGDGDKMLKGSTINDTCYQCHADKRGPFLWEHPPARENCMTCHSPHGSNNAKLLSERSSISCQQCHIHMLPRHSTTAGKAMDIFTFNRSCVNCHNQIHGSNHPGGRTFTR